MKKHYLYSSLATAALAFAACSSLPKLPANLQAGVDANNPEAFYKAGQYYDNLKNASKSSKWAKSAELYRKGAELGDAGCQHELGYAYQQGAGVPKDYGQSRAWYTKAAEQNHAGALCDLGYLYDHGIGVPVNYAVAKDYYERSRALGSAVAVNNLGFMYAKGHGVKEDKDKALKLYEQAAAMGNSTAKNNATSLRNEMNIKSPSSAAHKVFVMKYYTPRMVETAAETSVGPGNYTYTIGMVSDSCRDDKFDMSTGGFQANRGFYRECTYRKTGPKTALIKTRDYPFEGVQTWREIYLTFTSPNSGEMKMEFYGYNPHAQNPHTACEGTVYGTFEISGSTNRNFYIPEQD